MAEQILAIPATSAPVERVFSSAANIVNKKRVRLKPENVDLLVFLRGNRLGSIINTNSFLPLVKYN